jgi:hypothetical protein
MSGFIVGESLFNVALAGLIVCPARASRWRLPTGLSEGQTMSALIVGTAIVWTLYRWSARNGQAVHGQN